MGRSVPWSSDGRRGLRPAQGAYDEVPAVPRVAGRGAAPKTKGPARGAAPAQGRQVFGTAVSRALPSLMTTLNSTDLALCCFMICGICLATELATAS